ncbi:FMRFamide receptor-like [Brachionus plicatilis]|uniref:FMRFamide receptor-like n=1 Tax=Brachionus plicatilis TaxID=10195 RepID=A0A3M7SGU1_BRAPC|nr:FMRFamide receptor-like [Brachionus plicatilis]
MVTNKNDSLEVIEPAIKSAKQEHIVEFILLPFIFLVGTVCNFLTVLVMRRKKMRHQSTYFYMAVLAVADEMVLMIGCLNYWFYLFMNINIMIISEYFCKLACLLLYGMFHFCVWIVVIMTIERFIAVALPLQANRLCTVKRAKLYTLVLVCIIFLINIHFLFSHSVFKRNNSDELGCQPKNTQFEFLMLKIWPWIDASIYSFVPLSLLIIFNILIIHNLIKASKSIEKLNSSSSSSSTNPKIKVHRCVNDATNQSFYLFSFECLACCCCGDDGDGGNGGNGGSVRNSSHGQTASDNQQIKHNKYERRKKIHLFKFRREKKNSAAPISKPKSIYHQNLLTVASPKNQTIISSTSNLSAHTSSTSSANRRLTIMLLVISLTFFVTSTPIVTLQTIEQAGLVSQSRALVITRGIFIVLQYLNHSINFFLYAVTGKTFRREFFALFKSWSWWSSSSSSSNKKPMLMSRAHFNTSYNPSLSKNSIYNHYSISQQNFNRKILLSRKNSETLA